MLLLTPKRRTILTLVSPFLVGVPLYIYHAASVRNQQQLAILHGETHISNCFIQRLESGDLSTDTATKAAIELAALKVSAEGLKWRLSKLAEAQRKLSLGGVLSNAEKRDAYGGTGSVSCEASDAW